MDLGVAPPTKPLCLLSLDGGGVRGLSELIILDEIMLKIQKEKSLPTPPKPCEVFDLICGTSTGGIIALMLGRLRMTVQEVIGVYCDVSQQVFGTPKKHFSEGRFSATKLEEIMQRTVAKFGKSSGQTDKSDRDMKLLETREDTQDCKVFVCCRNARAPDTPRLFRSYRNYSAGEYVDMTIWEAARATSAAPTFFKRLTVGPAAAQEEFIDGGLGSNNPTKIMMQEACKIWKNDDAVACIISIGTGLRNLSDFETPTFVQKVIPKDLIKAMKKMVFDCETVEKDVSRWFSDKSDIYFRFNVEKGLEDIKLEDTKELGNLKTKTIRYLEQDLTSKQVQKVISMLCTPKARIRIAEMSMTLPLLPATAQPDQETHVRSDDTTQDPFIQSCMKSLAFAEMSQRAKEIESPADGTCEWLFQNTIMKNWIGGNAGLLWISGKPGSGKSTVMRYAFDQVQKEFWHTGKDLVLSFFFHGRGTDLQKSPIGLFRSLLYQVLSQTPDVIPELIAVFQKWHSTISSSDQEYQWSLPEAKRFFRLSLSKLLETYPVWLFVDALDECGEENAVSIYADLRSLARMPSDTDFQLRICFTCRHYPLLSTDSSTLQICMEDENKQDISKYVRDRFSAHPELKDSKITAQITERARGVFMWACLVVDRVLTLERKKVGLKEIERVVDTIPPDLSKLYDELIQNMDDKASSLKMFQWICFAMRPMTLDELRWAMVVDPIGPQRSEKEYQNTEQYIHNSERMEGRVKALSCGLVEIINPTSARATKDTDGEDEDDEDEENEDINEDDDDDEKRVVQFIHQSVQDFLVEKGLATLHDSLELADTKLSELGFVGNTLHLMHRTWTRSIQWVRDYQRSVDKHDLIVGRAHYRLSRTCIRYMIMDEVALTMQLYEHGRFSEGVYPTLVKMKANFPFLHYATTLWMTHAKQSESHRTSQCDLSSYFTWPSDVLERRWVPLHNLILNAPIYNEELGGIGRGISMSHVCAKFGLLDPLRQILEGGKMGGKDADSRDHNGRTPLSYAARNGCLEAVRMLLERDDVDINSRDQWGRTPLSYAARQGCEKVVKLLLERSDIEVDPRDHYDQTPLSYAVVNGREDVVKLLLEQGDVEADSRDKKGQTPLSYAASSGRKDVVKLLLERGGVEADSRDNEGQTPLSYAAFWGRKDVVKLLLERGGVEVDSRDNEGRTPLSYAAWSGRKDVVKLLLERGDVEADSRDNEGRTPLSDAAARRRGKDVVKLLLERGDVEADSRDNKGRTPLSYAASSGGEDVVKLLLERSDVDLNSKDKEGRTPLWYVNNLSRPWYVREKALEMFRKSAQKRGILLDSGPEEGRGRDSENWLG